MVYADFWKLRMANNMPVCMRWKMEEMGHLYKGIFLYINVLRIIRVDE